MSVLSQKADIRQRIEHACFVPIADIAHWLGFRKLPTSFKNLFRCTHGVRSSHSTSLAGEKGVE